MSRVVLLGASNLALAFPLIVRRLISGLPQPLELFAAFGHGRSYCRWSRVLFRGLPGIDACDLWQDLERDTADRSERTFALITDVGNDLIYGSTPAVIARRIESCLSRLAEQEAEIVITRLPLSSIERLSALRFHATKAIFFPRTTTNWPTMQQYAREMDKILCEMAAHFSARLIEQPSEWYGFDPIHIRRTRRHEAWKVVFSGWPSFDGETDAPRIATRDAVRLHLAAPAERRLFGRHQRRAQPALMLGDVAIRLY